MKNSTAAMLFALTSINVLAQDLNKYCEDAFLNANEPAFTECFKKGDALSPVQQYTIARGFSLGLYPPLSRDKDGRINSLNDRDNEKAIYWYRKAAMRGQGNAAITLAEAYRYGRNMPKNYIEAIKFYEIAAIDGFPKASSDLSKMYLEGKGVKKSVFMAYVWDGIALYQKPYDDRIIRQEMEEFEHSLSPSDVNRAQQLIQSCITSNLKNCTYR